MVGLFIEDCFPHDNNDRPRWQEAFNAAVSQTEHEWCRVLNVAKDTYGFAGTSLPMALWVAYDKPPYMTPHPLGTACERDVVGPLDVNVRIVDLALKPFSPPDDPAIPHGSFVAYTGDFRHSDRTLIRPDSPTLPSDPLALCLKPSDTFVTTLWGWRDRDDLGNWARQYDPGEEVYNGVTLAFDAAQGFGAGRHVAESDDLRVEFEITRPFVDEDADGLSVCGEAAYGTSPSIADTDGDGLLDGAEVDVYRTSPTKPDTDGDGLSDGVEVNGSNPTNPLVADGDGDGLADGVEDANHNGALDAGETNPNDADGDDDLLLDGCEVKGSLGTSPLDADSDDDGLVDGAEDANHSCARDADETGALDPDSDDDELNDGIEVANGTNPLVADSDGDGIIDGEDVDWLQPALNALPAEAFRAQGTRISTLGVLDAVEDLVARGQIDQALRELDVLRARLDGCGSAADANDWVVACAAQARIRSFIDLLTANLVS